jgi:hypothetical protein
MRTIIRGVILLVLVYSAGLTLAQQQSGGQICVRGFEDRNGNGSRDGGEPLLTRGLSATLQNSEGVVIASALLDNSPLAASGVVCFQFLPAGQYTVSVTSADYSATTQDSITTNVSESGVPPLLDFGARLAEVPTAVPAASTTIAGVELDEAQLVRIIISALAALAVIAGMIVLGLLIWLIGFRNRQPAPVRLMTTTGSVPVVKVNETGTHNRA